MLRLKIKKIISNGLSLLYRAAENARKRREALTAVGSVDINALPVSKISDVAANITAGYNDKVIIQHIKDAPVAVNKAYAFKGTFRPDWISRRLVSLDRP